MINGKRIKSVRKSRKMTQEELADKCGLNRKGISKYESGAIKTVNSDTLFKLADVLETTSDYLLGLTDIEGPDDLYGKVDTRPVPVYGSIPAGTPIEALQVDEGYIEVESQMFRGDKKFIALKVKGDSMYPFYLEGDIILIELTTDFKSGDDVAVYVGYDYEATLKRIHKRDNCIELEPLNREYKSRTFSADDEPVRVLGVVRELRRKI